MKIVARKINQAGWQTKRLGEVCNISRGGSPRPIHKFITTDSNGINWIKIGDSTSSDKYIFTTEEKITAEGAKRSRIVHNGDFLLSNSMSFGRPYIMRTTGCVHDGWLVLSNYQAHLEQDYLYYVLGSQLLFQQFDRLAAGSTVRNLNIELASRVEIPLPPLPEQQRIVAILDKAFEEIATAEANAEKNLTNARELFDSYLEGIFANKGEGWEEKTLGEILQKAETINPLLNPNKEFIYIDVSSVNKENLSIENTTLVKGKDAPSRARKLVKTGDVIFATVRPTLRRIATIPKEFDAQVCSTGYFVLRTMEQINNKLVFYFLQTKAFMGKLDKLQKGASYPAVTDGDVRNQIILYPKSLSEQQSIITKLDELYSETKKLETIYQQKLTALEELKKSILNQAFTGQLN